jgi:hypothetical protein
MEQLDLRISSLSSNMRMISIPPIRRRLAGAPFAEPADHIAHTHEMSGFREATYTDVLLVGIYIFEDEALTRRKWHDCR